MAQRERSVPFEKMLRVLRVREVPDPVVGPEEVLVDVVSTAVNRAEVLQRMGMYPPPPGAPDVLGLEIAGGIVATGEGAEESSGRSTIAAMR